MALQGAMVSLSYSRSGGIHELVAVQQGRQQGVGGRGFARAVAAGQEAAGFHMLFNKK